MCIKTISYTKNISPIPNFIIFRPLFAIKTPLLKEHRINPILILIPVLQVFHLLALADSASKILALLRAYCCVLFSLRIYTAISVMHIASFHSLLYSAFRTHTNVSWYIDVGYIPLLLQLAFNQLYVALL